ncbi:MAG: T9SS type A sorting domain-containing protein, partial [Bacteroidales bacterium]|nr:T9SS type A sorting domain-containing protein [Bacteroidales bacterium]
FDPVANVSMRLQPNPATSNVNIVMKGATGVVNMALIDMSGRVVSTSQFNAENGYNLNVSNLAKGAYFVRITNNKFNKIEKLIVR